MGERPSTFAVKWQTRAWKSERPGSKSQYLDRGIQDMVNGLWKCSESSEITKIVSLLALFSRKLHESLRFIDYYHCLLQLRIVSIRLPEDGITVTAYDGSPRRSAMFSHNRTEPWEGGKAL